VQSIRTVVTASVLTVVVGVLASTPATAAVNHTGTSPGVVVAAVQGRTLAPGWSSFAADSTFKPVVASETAADGRLGVTYFAFPTARDAEEFEARPSKLAVVQGRGVNPVAYVLAGQDGFNAQSLNKESTVYTFKGGVGIFLQQGTTIVLGTYLGAPPRNRSGYDLLSDGLSRTTQKAAALLSAKPTGAPPSS
jgi:hypothetical protein